VIDTSLRLVVVGARAGRLFVGVCLLPARMAWDAATPYLEARVYAALDAALEGPLTEYVVRAIGEHRVIERIVDELIANGTVSELFDRALESDLLLELTDRVMASEEMNHLVAHLASSPELRAAISEQTSGLADDMVAGVRRSTVNLDDVAERTVRGWLRRPRVRPQPT
jgi:hypothetical protein